MHASLHLAHLGLLGLLACHSPRDPRSAIAAAARAFDAAQLRKDRATLEQYLATDLVFVRGSGVVAGRTEFLAAFTDPQLELAPYQITKPTFVLLGEHAGIVGGEAVMEGTDAGVPFREHFRYADVFAWRDGRWQCVYIQVTKL